MSSLLTRSLTLLSLCIHLSKGTNSVQTKWNFQKTNRKTTISWMWNSTLQTPRIQMSSKIDSLQVGLAQGPHFKLRRGVKDIRKVISHRLMSCLWYQQGEREILVRRKPDSDDWDSIFSYNTMTESGIYPVGFGLDPNLLYYKAYHNDKRQNSKTEA